MKQRIQNQLMQHVCCLGLMVVGVMVGVPAVTEAATSITCTFTRDLEMGVTGDDVLCLQKYLNTHGFTIAASGVGSAGHETGEYKTLTEAAVIKWQKANKLAPAIGYFGAQSRLFFKKGAPSLVTSAGTPAVNAPLLPVPASTSVTDPDAALRAQVEALKAMLEGRTPILTTATGTNATVAATVVTPVITTPTATSGATVSTDASVRKVLGTVLSVVSKADSAIKKNSKASGISDAKATLAAAKDEILIALRAYITGDYATAETTLGKAKKDATRAYAAANTASEKQRADKSLSDVQSNYDDADDEISQADDDGKDVTSAKRLLKKAANAIDDVETAIDEENYDDALDAADTADGLISDAMDAID
jgi:hypothetical protein